MNLPHQNRWKETPAGIIVPEEFDTTESRFSEIVLRLPCYEPAGTSIDIDLASILTHMLIVGSTGSGKSSLLNRVWQELIGYRSSTGERMGLLIIDSQGDHTVTNVRRLAAEAGRADDVRVLSPHEGYLNPMGELDSFASLESVASKIVSATNFTSQTGDNRDAYWTENTRALIDAGLVYLIISKTEVHMLEALDFLADLFLQAEPSAATKEIIERGNRMVANAPHISAGIRVKIETAQRTVAAWSKFDSRTKSIIQSCLGITLLPLLVTTALPYWDVTKKGGRVDPAEALAGKIVVVSTRAATEVETAQMICRLVKMDFYGAAQRRRSLGNNIVTGLLMDEFHYAATKGSPRWSDISNLATLRGKGVFVIAATQGLVQLDLLLGGLATDALLINFNNLILMRSVEIGHLYHFAERIFGYRPRRVVPGHLVERGNLLVPGPVIVIPPEPVCPPGALVLDPHQAFVSLANGYKSLEPVWLAPLFMPEPKETEPVEADVDLALLRRTAVEMEKLSTPPVVPEASFYSLALWEFLVKAAPRQVRAMQVMSLKELRDALKGVHCEPDGLETLPPSWRLACFNLARRLRPSVQLRQVKVSEGKLSVVILPRFKGTNTIDLIQLEDRWRRSVYPTPLRPLHRRDRRWLEKNFPHLSSEIFETRKPTSP